ncbi:MAG TPA: serine/threonine-protein kinase [Gemmatimonadaceae bacterium]|nr:serine/threonine-protein kinase [Gemmatimonadaceae bacterium]
MTGTPTPNDLRSRLERSLGASVTIERELGGGGMARVFLGTERALDRRIVVKVLDLESAVQASAERFRREIKLVAQLQHPHIVPVFTAGGDDTLLWYAMPYVSGESLRARLAREGALPVADAVRITREVLDALGAAHAHGIVHRDVKPENILLEGSHAQVADFGVAKALAEAGVTTGLTTAGFALGTPAYMAPEQAMADPTTNHRADLYATGVVLYEMLVGAPPFAGNAQSVISAHLTAPIPQVSDRRRDVPPAVAGLTARLLAKNPAERPQSAAEALAALESITTPSAAPMPAPPAVKRRVPLIVAAALGIAGLGAAAVWAASRPARPDFAEGTEVIAIMPLGTTGDTALARLGRDLVVTLSANIDGVGSVRTVDPMSVLQRAGELPQPVPLDAARSLGASLGATYILHGSLVPDAGGVRLDAALHEVAGTDLVARLNAHGAPALQSLTDSISSQLFRQIWRRGAPPSPMLADAATGSGDALRAFLEGEAAFERLDTRAAMEAYDRATQLDSNFVQAWLRKQHLRSAAVLGVDTVANRRVNELVDRLPARDRASRLALPPGAGFHERQAALEGVAARFPEYHMAQYRAGDPIIHNGPLYGIPITNAIPYLDRLDSLAPRHADNAQHRLFMAFAGGDTATIKAAAQRLAELAPGPLGGLARGMLMNIAAYERTGGPPDAAVVTEALRAILDGMRDLPVVAELGLLVPPFLALPAQLDSAYRALEGNLALAAFRRQYLLGLGSLQFSRGDIPAALETFARLETMTAPADVRAAGIRSAAMAAWLGLMPLDAAEAAVARSRRNLTDGPPALATEVLWSDAVLAIAARDTARFQAALRALDDTTPGRLNTLRGLRGLWRHAITGEIDSLKAHEDELMQRGTGAMTINIALSRLAIGRALTLAGDPKGSERYLMWLDGITVARRATQVQRSAASYTAYERGIAAEAAGDRRAAILHLRRFVELVDKPPPGIIDQVNDAKARLARLTTRGG